MLYESPKRLARTLKEMLDAWGERKVSVARELTKLHEEVFRGTISGALAHFAGEVRGEIALVVEGFKPEAMPSAQGWEDALGELLQTSPAIPVKEAAAQVAARFGVSRRMVYQYAVGLKDNDKK